MHHGTHFLSLLCIVFLSNSIFKRYALYTLIFRYSILGIAKYFTSFTASSLVGAGKPNPIIFNAALKAQGVTAEESLYVDDYKLEADGAREQGFTSFLIDRSGNDCNEWTVSNLKQLIEYAEKHN